MTCVHARRYVISMKMDLVGHAGSHLYEDGVTEVDGHSPWGRSKDH